MPQPDLDIVHREIEKYLHNISPERDDVLTEMEVYATKNNFPIVGPLVGRMLFTLAASINAKKILEHGSGFGYSALWFAKATKDDARIICTEASSDNVARGIAWLKRADMISKIDYRTGNALDIITTVNDEFDIIFSDIDKQDYPKALHMSLPLLRKGGLFITDNVLWKGRILHDAPDATTSRIMEFNHLLYSTPNLFTTIVPIRDGVSISIKL